MKSKSAIRQLLLLKITWAKLCFLLLSMVAFSSYGSPEHAYMDGNKVYLPVVEDFPFDSSYVLRLLPKSRPQIFILESVGDAGGSVTASAAWFDGELLVIPEIWIKDVSFWAELRVISTDKFQLESYGRNHQQVISQPSAYEHLYWERIPGHATDIGVGADGTVWAVGESEYGNGFGLYHWDGYRWYEQGGSAIRVDVDPAGRPWVINEDNQIFVLNRGYWERIRGAATDIGIGGDGSVWVLGVREHDDGFDIYRLSNNGWSRVEGAGVRIDVDPNGRPWVVNHDDEIYRLEGAGWRRIEGDAKDIGIGADGSVWVIGTNKRASGYGVYRYNGVGWDKVNGSGRQISVGPDGEPWVVNRQGEIYQSWDY